MSFARELAAEVADVERSLNDTWQNSVAQTFNMVVTMTPVDEGAARNSWLAATAPDNNIGDSVLSLVPQQVPKVGGTFTLYSNLEYIEYLEDGSSQQAPAGMVKIAEASWDAIVRSNS